MSDPIVLSGRRLWMHKGINAPKFTSEHVLSDNRWLFVELWLKQEKQLAALSFWRQSQRFYEASQGLSTEARPLTTYYCFLNAAKALLHCKNVKHSDRHGVAGRRPEKARAALNNETVTFQAGGVLPSICSYLGEHANNCDYLLSDILWNIPFIHRAYTITYKSKGELFIPLENVRYVVKPDSSEAYMEAQIVARFADRRKLTKIPNSFECFARNDKMYVRRRKNLRWISGRTSEAEKQKAIGRLERYHASARRVVVNITGQRDLWYLKRINPSNNVAERHVLPLIFAATHRLSELSRYDPEGLERHLAGKASWLLSEFIEGAADQFIDQIATEITGLQFWSPKTR